MSIIEKTLADELVERRAEQALDAGYIPIATLIDALQRHLDREMELRNAITAIVDGETL